MFTYIRQKSIEIRHGFRRMLDKHAANEPPSLDLKFLEDRILYSGVALASELLAAENTGDSGGIGTADDGTQTTSVHPDAFA